MFHPILNWLNAHRLFALLFVAAVLRLAVLVAFPSVFAFEETGAIHGSEAYDTYARNLIETGVYGRTPGVADAAIPPLYSYALAGVYSIFGRGHWQSGLFHILLDVLSIAMLFEIGKRLFPTSEWVGWIAGLCYAAYPYLIFQNLTLIDTPFFIFLLHAFVLLMVLLWEREQLDRGTWILASLGGLVFGLSVLARPITPPLAVLVAVWFLFRRGFLQTVVRLLPVAALGTLVVLTWIYRNYTVFDQFVPMTTTSGANFWQGNSQYTIPYFRAGYDVQWSSPEEQAGISDPLSPEADAERVQLALTFMRENPELLPELYWVKFLIHWSIDIAPRYNPVTGEAPRLDYAGYPDIEANEDGSLAMSGLPENDPVDAYSAPLFDQIGRLVHRFYFGPLFLLALVGVILTLSKWRDVSLLWFVQISMTAVYMFFHPSTRYRVPTDPMLFLFSAFAIVWIAGRLQRWRQSRQSA